MIFYLATPLLIFSALPQTIKLIRTKSSRDISILTYTMTLLGVTLIFIRALQVGDLAIILGNGGSLLFLLINTCLIIKYRKHVKNS